MHIARNLVKYTSSFWTKQFCLFSSGMSSIDAGKKAAARAAVDNHISVRSMHYKKDSTVVLNLLLLMFYTYIII